MSVMADSVMTNVLDATVFEKNALKDLLAAIVKNCRCDSSFQVFSHPDCIGIMYVNHPGATPEDSMHRLDERLKAAFKIISCREGNIYKVSGNFANSFPTIEITDFNRNLLQHALKQELTPAAGEEPTGDMCAWTSLPKIIQTYWRYFNDQLRTHIMDCMMEYLQKQFGVNLSNLANSSTLFSTASSRQFPYIPVRLAQAGIDDEEEDLDLMVALATKERKLFSKLEPAPKIKNLKFRLSEAGTATQAPVADTPTPLRR